MILIVDSAIDSIQIWKLLNQNMNIVSNAASKAYHRNFRIKHHHTCSYSFEVNLIQLIQNHVEKLQVRSKRFSLYKHSNDFHETVYVTYAHSASILRARGAERLEWEAEHSPTCTSTIQVKNEWRFTSTFPKPSWRTKWQLIYYTFPNLYFLNTNSTLRLYL